MQLAFYDICFVMEPNPQCLRGILTAFHALKTFNLQTWILNKILEVFFSLFLLYLCYCTCLLYLVFLSTQIDYIFIWPPDLYFLILLVNSSVVWKISQT